MDLDFTLTACARPGILRDTLESFRANLRGVDLSQSVLFVNVDPVPAEVSPHAVIDVCDEFFGCVCPNLPPEPSFPTAVKWCYARPGTPYFFGLEDDWRLMEPVDVNDMAALLDDDPALSVVNCRAYRHNDERICLAPGLWRTDHAKAIAAKLVTHANPERQLRPVSRTNPHGGLHKGYKGMQFPSKPVIQDLGRLWLAQLPYKRDAGRLFTRWVPTSPPVPAAPAR